MPSGRGTVPLRASGKDIVDADGNPVHLTGFGLGGWLMHEGYMIGYPGPCGGNGGGLQCATPRFMRANIEAKVGKEQSDAFYAEYQKNYVTEADIAQLAEWGFNSVRLPFNANALLPEEGQPSEPPFYYDEAGFAPIDDLVAWAEKYGMHVILDMHAAPGAQSVHNIADSDGGDRLWDEPETYWPRTVELWVTLAKRYAESSAVVGYDLINEPMVPGAEVPGTSESNGEWTSHDNTPLRELYIAITEALRAAGDGKIVFAEAAFWGLNFEDLTPPWDDNLVYSFHYYPPPISNQWFADPPISTSFAPVFALDVPMWHGETGEWRQDWIDTRQAWIDHNAQHTEFMRAANLGHSIGWAWWTTKKFEHTTQPWVCRLPASYQALVADWEGTSVQDAAAALMDMARALQTEQCMLQPDLVTALGGAP